MVSGGHKGERSTKRFRDAHSQNGHCAPRWAPRRRPPQRGPQVARLPLGNAESLDYWSLVHSGNTVPCTGDTVARESIALVLKERRASNAPQWCSCSQSKFSEGEEHGSVTGCVRGTWLSLGRRAAEAGDYSPVPGRGPLARSGVGWEPPAATPSDEPQCPHQGGSLSR